MSGDLGQSAVREFPLHPPQQARQSETAIIDVDVHEVMQSVRDLLPYLDEPWRGRIEAADGWKGPAGLPYSYPMVGGVARADAAAAGGAPAGSEYELMKLQLLDEYNVEYAVLVSMFHPTDLCVQPEFATALASAYNSWLLEHWLPKDERFLACVTVAAQNPEAAAREIDRVGSHPQIVQVLLPATSQDVLARPFYHPIYAAAVRNGLAVAFHQTVCTETAVGLPPYYIEWHVAIPQAWQCQLVGLVCQGVFDKFPDIRVVLLESGWTWVPSLMWRFDLNYRGLRREIPWVKRLPSDYIREHVRIATQPMEYPENLQDMYRMFELIGTDDFLLFASDYPHWDFDSPVRAVPRPFPKEIRSKIMSDNARNFYRLP